MPWVRWATSTAADWISVRSDKRSKRLKCSPSNQKRSSWGSSERALAIANSARYCAAASFPRLRLKPGWDCTVSAWVILSSDRPLAISNSLTTNNSLLPPMVDRCLRTPGATARIKPNSRVKTVSTRSDSPIGILLRLIPVAL